MRRSSRSGSLSIPAVRRAGPLARWPRVRRSLRLALALAAVSPLGPAVAEEPREVEAAFVYKPDGSLHCETAPGESLDAMAHPLVEGGIAVRSSRKAHDGREGIAVCENPTGSINVYEIDASDLPRASKLGFQRLDPAWLEPR